MVTPTLLQLETLSPDTRLRRREAADALTQAGYPITSGTLANLACQGGGPPFSKWGKIPIYIWGITFAWAKARATPMLANTAAHRAAVGRRAGEDARRSKANTARVSMREVTQVERDELDLDEEPNAG